MSDAIVVSAQDGGDDILPPHQFTAAGLCEVVLRKIGAFSINDTSAQPEQMAETLRWLDINASHLAGTQECFWLRPATITLELEADATEPYVLSEIEGWPRQGVVFVLNAWLRDPNGNDTPIEVYRRAVYEAFSQKDTAGQPWGVYVDRLSPRSTLLTYPVISDDDWSIRLQVQSYHPGLTGAEGDELPKGDVALGFGAAFQKFLVFATAADVGDGPVRQLDDSKIKEWRAYARVLWSELQGYINREKPRQVRTRRHDGGGSPMFRRDPYTSRRYRFP